MNLNLEWVHGSEIKDISCFTSTEMELVCSGGNVTDGKQAIAPKEADLEDWYRSEFELSPDGLDGKYCLFNFGYIQDIKQAEFYFNGQQIGITKSACVQAAFLVPEHLANKGKNSILVRVISDTAMEIGDKT
jgi:hypothetical protein